ncbi:MAG: hypothetical protein U1E45_06270 [Geminicoccaceae bacterium]
MRMRVLASAVVAAAGLAMAAPASATNLLGSTSSATISGTTFGFGPSAMPWTAEVYSGAGGCLRIAVTSQATDLKATVVAPNGTVYRDDDSGGSLRPLVKINNTPNNGWYTLSINNFSGAAVSANFTVTLQRLAANSASCLPATGPLLIANAAAKARSSTGDSGPKPGEAGAR